MCFEPLFETLASPNNGFRNSNRPWYAARSRLALNARSTPRFGANPPQQPSLPCLGQLPRAWWLRNRTGTDREHLISGFRPQLKSDATLNSLAKRQVESLAASANDSLRIKLAASQPGLSSAGGSPQINSLRIKLADSQPGALCQRLSNKFMHFCVLLVSSLKNESLLT